MDDDTRAFAGLTLAVIIGLAVLIYGVLLDAESMNPFTASGSGIIVFAVMGMAGYLNRL